MRAVCGQLYVCHAMPWRCDYMQDSGNMVHNVCKAPALSGRLYIGQHVGISQWYRHGIALHYADSIISMWDIAYF